MSLRNRYYMSQTFDHIMPYIDDILENIESCFIYDSSSLNTNATLLKITNDDKYEYITYFNEKGVISKFKRKIKKTNKEKENAN